MREKKETTTINIEDLIDEEKCYETVRKIRWPEEISCPHCTSIEIIKNGYTDEKKVQQRYICKSCHSNFDDLTNTIFSNHHQPLSKWILSLYFMGLNLSNNQIAKELDIDTSVCQNMTTVLREAVYNKRPEVILKGEVEFDEVYVVAGHKGHPEEVKKSS